MNQSRKLLGIGHEHYKKAKAKVPSTDNDNVLFNKAHPNASHQPIEKSLHVGIARFQKVTAAASGSGPTIISRSDSILQIIHGHSIAHSADAPVTKMPWQYLQH